MANTKISQLTEYTGSTLGGFMVFNDSGETTTYKYELPVDLGNLGGSSPVDPYGIGSIKLSGQTLPDAMSASTNSIFLGTDYSGNTIYGSPNGGTDNSLSVGIGNNVNRLNGNTSYTYMFGKDNANRGGSFLFKFGEANSTNANSQAAQFGYNNQSENGSYQYQFGQSNNTNGGSYLMMVGQSNNMSGNYVHHFGQSNATNNGGYTTLFGQNNNYASPWGLTAGNGNVAEFSYNYLFGYQNWNWTQHSITTGYQNKIVGSSGSDYDTAGFYNAVLGGNNNKIQSEGARNSFIVSNNSFITGDTENVVMLGTSGRTNVYTYTTHVENIHTYKTETFDVIDAGSVGGSIDVNMSAGTLFKFSMTADTTPNFINWREGQRMTFIVENTGTFSVPTMTISGGGSVLTKGGSVNPTNNGITKYTGVIISGDLYLDEQLDFIAL